MTRSPHQDYQDEPGVQQQIGYGVCQRHDLPGLRLCLPLGLVGCVKAIPLPDLTGEGLYHPHPGGVLPEDAHHRVHSRLSSGVVGDPPPGHQRNGEKGEKLTASCTSAREGSSRKVSINPPNTSMGARMPPRWTLSNIWWTL